VCVFEGSKKGMQVCVCVRVRVCVRVCLRVSGRERAQNEFRERHRRYCKEGAPICKKFSRRFRADETHNHTSLPHGRRAILENPVVAASNALFRGAVGSSFATSFKSGHSTLSTDWLDPEDDLPDSPLSDDI